MSFWTGTPESFEQRSTLSPEQQGLYKQLLAAIQGQGAGGAFGQSADYYRGLLGDNSEDFQAFAAPEQRRFQQETIPGLAEQFAGMGSGALSSSGFRNAAVNAGTDLSERLGAIRAQLRQQGAQGLAGLAQQGFMPTTQNIHRPRQPGFLEQIAPGVGMALGSIGGTAGVAAGKTLGDLASQFLKNKFGNPGNTQPSPTAGV